MFKFVMFQKLIHIYIFKFVIVHIYNLDINISYFLSILFNIIHNSSHKFGFFILKYIIFYLNVNVLFKINIK